MSGTIHEPETERAFCQPGDDIGQLRAVHEVVHDAKRDILLRWYAQATRRGA